MKQKIEKNKWLFKQFTMINRTATTIYENTHNGVDQNFYNCYLEYEDGVFGWVKEAKAFHAAIEIYEQYTANDGWDIIGELEEAFGEDLKKIEASEIKKWEDELADVQWNTK